jgi:maltooligosyltrehalose trehalohydrolase
MDATHAVHDSSPVHLLSEAARTTHERGGFIIAEDDRNSRAILEPHEKRGWNFDAVWSDDFHHSMRVSQTGEQQWFLSMFRGGAEEIGQILKKGWLYSGQYSSFCKQPRGTPADDFPPQSFVFCISNHDQVGNRIQGDRFHESMGPAAYRALSLFLCLIPYTPLIFMGQEWGASAPFQYFTDMPEELGRKIAEGRKREFLENGFTTNPAELEGISNPQELKTFLRSKLDWSEIQSDHHRRLLDLYQAGLKLRKEIFGGCNPPRDQWRIEIKEDIVAIHYHPQGKNVSVYLRLKSGGKKVSCDSPVLLRSNAPEFTGSVQEEEPETIVTASL